MNATSLSNVDVVKKAFECLFAGPDWEGLSAWLADDCQLFEAPTLPYGGTYSGKPAVIAGIKAVFAAFNDFSYQVQEIFSEKDKVIVQVELTATGRKTGKTFSMPLLELWRLRGGKIVEIRPVYFDTARVNEVFG